MRVVAATNRNLLEEIDLGRFRRDLYYRLAVFPITLPPLRELKSDMVRLVQYLVGRLALKHRHCITRIPPPVLDTLLAHDWPGNVRELENVLERAIIMTPGSTLRLPDPLVSLPSSPSNPMPAVPGSPVARMVDVERAHILSTLQRTDWRVEGNRGAAFALGMNPSTLRARMRRLGIWRTRTACALPVTACSASQARSSKRAASTRDGAVSGPPALPPNGGIL